MKILVSSKSFARSLRQIDFANGDHVRRVAVGSDTTIMIETPKKTLMVNASVLEGSEDRFIDQFDRRWDFILDLLSKVEDQPTTIEIYEKRINVKFQY